jgi:hypothetical protein
MLLLLKFAMLFKFCVFWLLLFAAENDDILFFLLFERFILHVFNELRFLSYIVP